MNNDISNVTRLGFTSSPQGDGNAAKFQAVKNKHTEQVVPPDNVQRVNNKDSLGQERESDGKQTDNLISLEDVKQLAEQGNKVLAEAQRNLQFKVDETTNQVVVSVVDQKSGEVLRQIPSDEVLALAKRLKELDGEQLQGVFLKEQA
ncbi:flagellar protein FlaG [Methylotuvimicrobium sp. KM2]|uniref:flagellar protein FlaG n=1 Tax=Methylotuvimicrobium sp. KM2 TaxID=3133976 RepID=UPI0031018214